MAKFHGRKRRSSRSGRRGLFRRRHGRGGGGIGGMDMKSLALVGLGAAGCGYAGLKLANYQVGGVTLASKVGFAPGSTMEKYVFPAFTAGVAALIWFLGRKQWPKLAKAALIGGVGFAVGDMVISATQASAVPPPAIGTAGLSGASLMPELPLEGFDGMAGAALGDEEFSRGNISGFNV